MSEENTPNIIEELFSRGSEHKAIIQEHDTQRLAVSVYELNAEQLDPDGIPMWERVAGPIVVDDETSAKAQANQHLALFSLEIPDPHIEHDLHNFVVNEIGHDDYAFFLPENYNVEYLSHPEEEHFEMVEPQKVLCVEDFYFVENQNQWFTGFLHERGRIRGWQSFDDLKTALQTILK